MHVPTLLDDDELCDLAGPTSEVNVSMEGIIQTVQSWPLSIHVIVAALILAIIHVYLKRDRPYPGLPIAQIQLPGYKYALQWVLPHLPWMLEPETVMQRGKDISKGSDGIYQVRASAGYKIVLPRCVSIRPQV